MANINPATTMSCDELLSVLGGLTDPRFSEAVATLVPSVRGGLVRISVSPRLVPGADLLMTYRARRDRCDERGVRIAGLNQLVETLSSRPETRWKIIAISGTVLTAAVFIAETGEAAACFVGTAPETLGEEGVRGEP